MESVTFNNYQNNAVRTAKVLNNKKDKILRGMLGLSGEVGEACDIVKKHYFQGHPLDTASLRKELGDCLWYLAVLANDMGWLLSDIAVQNNIKLAKRYGDAFSEGRSINRTEDKDE